MKNSQSIRKILFVSKANIALIVLANIANKNNILFAKQVDLNGAELKVKINDLLTHAANFLGFNIKEVEIIFNDPEIQTIEINNFICHDCNNETEVTHEFYKASRPQNYYVNEVSFKNIKYDDIEQVAIANGSAVVSNYLTFKTYINAAKACNLNVLNSTNLYTLLNNKAASSEVVLNFFNNKLFVSEYALSKLTRVEEFDLAKSEIYLNLANKFNTNEQSIIQMLNICNNIEATNEAETIVKLNYDIVHKCFNSINAGQLISAYQEEVNFVISKKFNLNQYSEVSVIANESINKLANAKVVKLDNAIGLEDIDGCKLLALAKIDTNRKENSHFKFESSISSKIHSIIA